MSATYIKNENVSNFQKFIIPFADILTGSYFLNSTIPSGQYWFCTFAAFRLINSPSGVLRGFDKFSLRQTGGTNQTIYDNSISSNPGSLVIDEFYTFSYNIQLGPTLYGCYTNGPRYIFEISGAYISGDGDIELYFYYNTISV
jgi:hypothetical protein